MQRANVLLKKLLNNSRFYILIETLLLSALVAFVVRSWIPNGELVGIRIQQLYGLLSLLYWYAALIVSPLKTFVSPERYRLWSHNRRALGVSAAYFAMLHFLIAFFLQSGGLGGLKLLPSQFRWAFLLGFCALIILLAMALTSTDWAVRTLTFRRWKWLHRLGYLAMTLVIIHVWLVGSQVGSRLAYIPSYLALILLFGLEALRSSRLLQIRYHLANYRRIAVAVVFFLILAIPLTLLPRIIKDYHHASGHVEIRSVHAH